MTGEEMSQRCGVSESDGRGSLVGRGPGRGGPPAARSEVSKQGQVEALGAAGQVGPLTFRGSMAT